MKPGVWPASASMSMSLAQRLAARVDLEDLRAALAVGPVDGDLAVEAAGAQQGGIEDVGPVGGRDHDDVVLGLEAVHLHEELVERLLALVVAAAEAGAAVAADRVDLVHEDDAGRVLLGLLEEVAHAGGADADEHLDEVRARDGEERHARLAGDGAREQRLAGARGPVEQHALGDARAERLELLRVLEELLDLVQLLDGLVDAGHVAEGDLRRVHRHPLRARLAERHDLRAAALHLVHQEDPEPDEDEERQDVGQQREYDARARGPSTPVANVDQATGDIEGTDVSSGRNTPLSASAWKCGTRPSRISFVRIPIHPVEAEDDHSLRLRVRVGIADADPSVREPERVGEESEERERERRDQDEERAGEREPGAGSDVGVRVRDPEGGGRAEDGKHTPFHGRLHYPREMVWSGDDVDLVARARLWRVARRHLESARKNLQGGQYDPAIDDAGQGLQASPDDHKTAWGLQLVILEANARLGKAAETKQKLEELAAAHPDRVTRRSTAGRRSS